MAFGTVFYFVPVQSVAKYLVLLKLDSLASASILIFLGILLSSLRFSVLSRRLRMEMSFRTAHFINIMSLVSGLVFFNVLGQMIARTSIAASYMRSGSRMAILTLFEKGISLLSLAAIALVGFYFTAVPISKDIHAQQHFYLILGSVALIAMVLWVGVFPDGQKRYIRRVLWAFHTIRLDYTLLTSLMIHVLTLIAYVLLGHFFLPDVPLLLLASAFSIVMLAASMPVSFAGWGIRELTAGGVFTALSLDPGVGVTVSILVGLLSLLMLGGHALIATYGIKVDKPKVGQVENEAVTLHVERAVAFFGGVMIAVLIGIQMHLPIGGQVTTVNFADPVSLGAGLTFMALWLSEHRGQNLWRVPKANYGFVLFIFMILMGWALGYMVYGGNSWASVNRTFGLIIIFSYLASGALFVAFFGRMRALMLIKISIIAAFVVYMLFLVNAKFGLLPHELSIAILDWDPKQFDGLVLNRNAFALQMLLAFSVFLVLPKNKVVKNRSLMLAFILVLLFASGSRAVVLTGFILIVLALYMQALDWRRLLRAGMLSAAIMSVVWLFLYIKGLWLIFDLTPIDGVQRTTVNITNVLLYNLSNTTVQADRMASYVDGFKMWLSNPVFGGGLGAFIESQSPRPLVIHNSLLWVLAEMGVVGLLMFLYLPVRLIMHALRNGLRNTSWEDAALFIFLVGVGIFSMAHEIAYQRYVWFVLGILIANKWQFTGKHRAADA